jgi:DNA-binding XRE family transcriptional regulator
MKITQSAVLNPTLAAEAKRLGAALARLRIARGIKQDQAALRAGLSRNTAYRLEKGDPGIRSRRSRPHFGTSILSRRKHYVSSFLERVEAGLSDEADYPRPV